MDAYLNTIGKRLKYAREIKEITQKEFCKILGFKTHVQISKWENDERVPRLIRMKEIAELLGVNLSWLVSGEGNMNKGEEKQDIMNHPSIEEIGDIVYLKEVSHVRAGEFATLLTLDDEPNTHPIPINLLPNKVKNMQKSEIVKKYFVFSVKGHSMQPQIKNGDRVIAERVSNFQNVNINDLVIAINEDDEIVVKKLKKKNGVFVLESFNSEFPDIEINPQTTAIGKVVASFTVY